MTEGLFIALGVILGVGFTWLLTRSTIRQLKETLGKYAQKEEAYQVQIQQLSRLEAEKNMLLEKVQEMQQQIGSEKRDNIEKEAEIRRQMNATSSLQAINKALAEKLEAQKEEMKAVREQLYNEFHVVANKILDENSRKFTLLNEEKVGFILNPLKEKINAFEKKVEETYNAETREKASLREAINQIRDINQQMSEDAKNLTKALKGDSKIQGNWGEVQLELLLEKAGLQSGVHYQKQTSFLTEMGDRQRPDFIINLPDNKNFIVDSKVSLTAYEKYFSAEDEIDRSRFLNEHLTSVNAHISALGSKNYQNLYGVNTPDYVFLFFPIEPAFTLAVQNDLLLFDKALNKNVILVGPSILLASMRTVSFVWKQENQRRNVLEIAKESGALYDKFVSFMEDLSGVGKGIDDMDKKYKAAMNKLFESQRKGDTIIGRIERIKSLGANTTKTLPQDILGNLDS